MIPKKNDYINKKERLCDDPHLFSQIRNKMDNDIALLIRHRDTIKDLMEYLMFGIRGRETSQQFMMFVKTMYISNGSIC